MKSTTTLLATATALDTDRRWRAVGQFAGYRLMPNGDLLNMASGAVYQVVGKSGCSCKDYEKTIGPKRAAMTAAGVATNCCCKHIYCRRLLTGRSVKVGASTFTALKK